MNVYTLFGAKKFQKVVFKIERIKYFIIEKFFPNIEKKYSNHLDKIMKKRLKKAKTEEQCKEIIENVRNSKMILKKEFLNKQNINYHINKNNIPEFRKYLLWNKQIHINGIKKDIVIIILSIIALILSSNFIFYISTIALITSIISALINFECVNLQNYNLDRLNKYEKRNKEKIVKKYIQKAKEYNLISTTIKKEFDKTTDIPNPYDILNKINNVEELKQFKKIILETRNNNLNNINKTKLKRKVR